MKKARSVLEISLIALLVIGVSIFTLTMYNNLKLKLANATEVHKNAQSAGTTLASTGPLNNGGSADIETAGASGTNSYRGSETVYMSASAERALKEKSDAQDDKYAYDIKLGAAERTGIAGMVGAGLKARILGESYMPEIPVEVFNNIAEAYKGVVPDNQLYNVVNAHINQYINALIEIAYQENASSIEGLKNRIANGTARSEFGSQNPDVIVGEFVGYRMMKYGKTAQTGNWFPAVSTSVSLPGGLGVSKGNWGGGLMSLKDTGTSVKLHGVEQNK